MTQRWHGYHSEQAYDVAESIAGGRSMLVGGYGATVYPTVAWSSINRPPPLLRKAGRREKEATRRKKKRERASITLTE